MNIWQKIKLGFVFVIHVVKITLGVITISMIFAYSLYTLYSPFMLKWQSDPGFVLAWGALILAAIFIVVFAGYVAADTQKLGIDLKKCDLVIYRSKLVFFIYFLLSLFFITTSISAIESIEQGTHNRYEWVIPWSSAFGTFGMIYILFNIFNFKASVFLIYNNGIMCKRLCYFWDKVDWVDFLEVKLVTKSKNRKFYKEVYIILNHKRIIHKNRWLSAFSNMAVIQPFKMSAYYIYNSRKILPEELYIKIKESATKYGYADKIKFYDNGKETSFGLDNII